MAKTLDEIREEMRTTYLLNGHTGQFVKSTIFAGWYEYWKHITKEQYEELKRMQPEKECKP